MDPPPTGPQQQRSPGDLVMVVEMEGVDAPHPVASLIASREEHEGVPVVHVDLEEVVAPVPAAFDPAGQRLPRPECPEVSRDRLQVWQERVPDTFVNGNRMARLPNTSNPSFSGIESDAALVMFDRHRLCCSAGSACRTGSLETSHVLRAMNLPPERARASMRFSFGRFNTEADVDKALEIIPATISKLRALSPSRASHEPASV